MSKIFFTAKNDKVFKTILGNEENKELLKTFLERILKKQIDELTFLKNELPVNYPGERRKTVDLLVKIKKQYIHIELNNGYYNYLHMRNFCFFTNTYSKKTKSGEKYNIEDKFLHIDFTYRNQITKENKDKKLADLEVCRVYKMMDKEQKEYIENFEIWEYNMDRIMQIWYDKDEKMSEYKHLIMLDCKKEELEELSKGDEFVEEFKKEVEELNENETYTSWLTPEEDEKFILNTEKSISFQEGINQGITQGITQGVNQEKIKIAKNLLNKNMNIKDIMDITGLTRDEIKNL